MKILHFFKSLSQPSRVIIIAVVCLAAIFCLFEFVPALKSLATSSRAFAVSYSDTSLVKYIKDDKPIVINWQHAPEPVYSVVVQDKPHDWYIEQAALWNKEVEKHPDNALAWEYLFQANYDILFGITPLSLQIHGMTDSLPGILARMKHAVPNSFEYYFDMYYYWSHYETLGRNAKCIAYIEKAYQADSTRWEAYDDLATIAEIKNDYKDRSKYMAKWYSANRMSPSLLNWNYNMLMSLGDKAILITCGDNDTYPAWMLQDAKGVRKDVMIINSSLFMIDDYRRDICRELGIPFLETKPLESKTEEEWMNKLGRWLIQNITKRPVYFTESCGDGYYKSFEDSMYLEGLALRYSPVKYDNVSVLRNNVENRFLMDYLKTGFTNDISESRVANFNGNYIAPFITLYHYYNDKGNREQAQHYKGMALEVGEKADKKKEVEEALNKTKK